MHNEETLKSRNFSRRAFMMGAGKFSLLSLLAGRMYYLQIVKSAQYTTLSENNCIRAALIPAPRGNITDRYNSPLAINQTHYRVMIDKTANQEIQPSLMKLLKLLPIQEEEAQAISKRVLSSKVSQSPILVYSPLLWQDVVNIEVNAPELPGVYVDVGQIRFYPFSSLCAHITGYVGVPTEDEISTQSLLNHPDIKLGKNGIEKSANQILSGQAGIKRMEVDAHGLAIRELARENAVQGQDVALTIDIGLQDFVNNRLDPRGSSAIVIDILNGDVLALGSTPSFDPNQFTQGVSSKYWSELNHDPYLPMINRAISSQYPPGSTFKIMVALAALKEGITPDTIVHCPGYITLGNRKFHCWKEGGHGSLDMVGAIAHSCNCYFYSLAKRIGAEKFISMGRKFGLGAKTGIELPGESSGLMPEKKWKISKFKTSWQLGDTLNSAIGQGFLIATPVQLAVMAARIATGKAISPHLILDKSRSKTAANFPDLDVPKAHLDIIRLGMQQVVAMPGATCYGSRITEGSLQMAGKTGTSQVISKKSDKDNFSSSTTLWKHKNHGLFMAYAPADNPRYACAVVIEHGGSGAGEAAPVARDIFVELFKTNG